MAFYKLPRLQKISGSFSALLVSLHRRAWFTSALPFSAPVQPFTVPALPFTASSQCPYMAVPASWQPRGTASGVVRAYSVRTWVGEALVGRYADFGCRVPEWRYVRDGCRGTLMRCTAQEPNREATNQTTEATARSEEESARGIFFEPRGV